MSFFRLCSGDPVVSELRDVFRANIVRIPEQRIVPLSALMAVKKTVTFIGQIGTLLDGPTFEIPAADLMESAMPTLGNRRSTAVDGKVGMDVLSGFLSGMSGDLAAPDISVHLKQAKTFRFYFPSVERRFIEIARIGQLLFNRTLARGSVFTPELLKPETTLRLVDSVITSTDFEVELDGGDEATFKVDPRPLQGDLVKANIEVSARDGKHLTFRSKRRLAFAFTCVNVGLTSGGRIRAVAPSMEAVGSPRLTSPQDQDQGLEAHVLLSREPGFIDIDFRE
jgi:hypothetical protein